MNGIVAHANGVARYGLASLAALCAALAMPTWAGASAGSPTQVGAPVAPLKVTADPAKLKQGPAAASGSMRTVPEGEPLPTQPAPKRTPKADPKAQIKSGAAPSGARSSALDAGTAPGQISAPVVTVAGAPSNSNPPDTVGDVGRNHYVQMSNASGPGGSTGFFIVRKDGTAPTTPGGSGPFNFGALWPAGACNSNLGDPIVVYDHLADRWLLSQFAQPNDPGPGFLCVAISQTADPTANSWFLYTMPLHTDLPDYPKIGVWPDGYYVTTFEQANLGLYVLDRANMLLGNAAGFLKTTISSLVGPARNTRALPADLDGSTPPAGAPGIFVRTVDDQQDSLNPTDRIEVYEGQVNWQTNTFTLNQLADVAPTAFDTMTCNRGSAGVRSCIPQPGVTDTLDALSNRPMMQLKYRNYGSHQALLFNQTIDVQGSIQPVLGFVPGNEVAGVRWTELRKSGANWLLHQDGTYAPQPNGATLDAQLLHRWMGSAALDRFGNIGLAYSVVNSDTTAPVTPGLRYTGRTAADVAGLMPQGEQIILNGVGVVDNGNATVDPVRWGDYSALSIDPVDDCTFWFTSHVAGGPRVTRIASFRFADCATDLAVTKTASPNVATAGGLLTYTLNAVNRGPLDASGVRLVDTLPLGVSYVSDNAGCTRAANVLTCTIGALAVNQTRTVQVLVRVNANVVSLGASTVSNTVVISSDQGEATPADNTATLITQVVDSADLRISKQCKPDQPAPSGSPATCTLFVDNLGPSDARLVTIADTHLSNGAFTITGASYSPPGTSCPAVGGVVTCALPSLAAGAGVVVTVNFTAVGNIDVNDTASVSSATSDPNLGNNTATGKVSFVANADLKITKTASAASVNAGTNLTYLLTVTNNGPATAANVVVADVLPAQVQMLSATPSVGSCGGTTVPGDPAQPLTCNLGSLVNGGSATVMVVVKINSDTSHGTTLVNNATVSGAYPDPDNANNKATVLTAVNAVADLVALKTSDKPVYKPSALVTYTVKVTNVGPSKALAVQVVDMLPEVRQALYQSDTGGCTKSGGTLTCVLGDMAVGTSRSFNVYMVVKGSRGNITNTATTVSDTTDTNTSNNVSTLVVRVGN